MTMLLKVSLTDLSFKTIYNHLNPVQVSAFKRFVADELEKRSPTTLQNWLNDYSEPSAAEKRLITEYIQANIKNDITQADLFPVKP